MEGYVLQMQGINKAFNQVPVLKGVNLQVRPGEIHALLGENGAGKSTLMNILGGVHRPDAGELTVMGESVRFDSPRSSKAKGISFIHQELNVVTDLTVYANLYLGREKTNRYGFLNTAMMCEGASNVLNRMGLELDPRRYVRDLGPSYKQMVEIARALMEDAKVIIMDEPTTSLSEHEVERLMSLMRTLKESGVSIIYISHKLKEVLRICDRYTVLRDGTVAGNGEVRDTDEEQLTKLMVGRSVSGLSYYRTRPKGDEALAVNCLSSVPWFRNVSFSVQRGEIVGFIGLAGDGRTELFEHIIGYRKGAKGELRIHGIPKRIRDTKQALEEGIGFVPKDRKENGIFRDMSVLQNMSVSSLDSFTHQGLLRKRKEEAKFAEYRDRLNIKAPDSSVLITALSGGNQQKVILARWLEVDPDILVFDNPTQGIDVGAKSEVYQLIMNLAERGKAIILLSSEVSELQKLCDEVNVMYQGEITARLGRDEITEETVMLYATGARREERVL
ncbi:ABC transporter [Paenibacillus swuensis]|uniref:ABC transporter n=2 Tax=Paenibacillus swuensis TaxID=1178515 RepID=A0A172TIK3_9BACL|nr:ABC transporter [Paenibacillus swuensis]